jgi:hypothetical protein
MEKNYRGSIEPECLLHYDSGVNRCPIDGALEQLRHLKNPMSVIKKKASKHLVFALRQAETQEGARITRTAQGLPGSMPFSQYRHCQLHQELFLLVVEFRRCQTLETILFPLYDGCYRALHD